MVYELYILHHNSKSEIVVKDYVVDFFEVKWLNLLEHYANYHLLILHYTLKFKNRMITDVHHFELNAFQDYYYD